MIAAQSTITGQLGMLSTIAQITSSDLTSTTTSHMEDAADRELREALDEFDMPLKPPVYQWWQPELFASQSTMLSTIAQLTSSDLTSTTTSHMEDAADRELREALDEFDMPLKPPVYQWWQPELFASQSIAHHNNVISTSHLPATETVSSMLQRHIDSLADEQTCNGIDMRTGAQPVGPPRGDSARLLAQPLALPYSLSLAHDSIQSTPRALRASAPIRGGGIISSDSQLDSNPHKSILQSNTQIEINFCDSSQDNGTLHAMHLRGGARIDEQIIMRQLVEVGYAHIPNSPELNNQMQLLLGGKPCTYNVLPCNGQSQLQATDDRLQFTPIFQRYPTAMIPVNTGDGLRQMSTGRVLHHDDTAVWCGELARAQLATAQLAGVTDLLKAPLTLAENSILATLPPREPSAKVEFQGGHLDAMPTTLPSSNVLPTGVVMITPIDKNANVRAIPISVVAKLDRLPFHSTHGASIYRLPCGVWARGPTPYRTVTFVKSEHPYRAVPLPSAT